MEPPAHRAWRARRVVVLGLAAAATTVVPAHGAPREGGAPRAAGLAATSVTPDELALEASLAPGRRPTTYHASYARVGTRGWRRTAPRRLGPGRRIRAVGVRIAGLRPATAYRVRVVATVCAGCRRGTARSVTRRVLTPPRPAAAPPPPPPAIGEPAPRAEPTRTPPVADVPAEPVPAVVPEGFRNPVHDADFPDPFVLREDGAWYAYGTGARFPILRSTDLVTWTPVGHALDERPAWTTEAPWSPGMHDWHPWAPSVQRVETPCPGAAAGPCFVLFHVGLTDQGVPEFMHCVGVAVATAPTGPFTELGPLEREDGVRERGMPIGCGDDAGDGTIDPAPFVAADGQAYLYVSTDRRCEAGVCAYAPTISVIPLSATVPWQASGARVALMAGAAGTWEQGPAPYPAVENPWVVEREDGFHLVYSGGDWRGDYGMGHATAASPTGPFTRTAPTPWVWGDASVSGPGGGMLIADAAGDEWLAYHARSGPGGLPRTLRLDRVDWDEQGMPRLDGPTSLWHGPEPAALGG